MREIKFRAWHIYEETMCEVDLIRLDGHGAFLSGVRKGEDQITKDGKIIVVAPEEGRFCRKHEYELMQFTGLKDKNGKEIYEGDIVRILFTDWPSQSENDERPLDEYLISLTENWEVVFVDGKFLGRRHIGYHPFKTDEEGYTYAELIPGKYGYVEIIGNIHQNPELL